MQVLKNATTFIHVYFNNFSIMICEFNSKGAGLLLHDKTQLIQINLIYGIVHNVYFNFQHMQVF